MDKIINQLRQWEPIPQAVPPESKGFYAFYIINESCFDGTVISELKKYDVLYIGIAKDETLAERVFQMHLRDSGKSTLRRSLGAVLKDKLELNPIMRGVTPTPANIRNYTFCKESEKRLTDFMYGNLGIAFCACNNIEYDLEEIEKVLIEKFKSPAFNIVHSRNQNQYSNSIKSLRKTCRDIVKDVNR